MRRILFATAAFIAIAISHGKPAKAVEVDLYCQQTAGGAFVPASLTNPCPVTGGTGGTASSYGAAFPGTGTAIGAKNGSNMVFLGADGSNNLNVNCVVGCSGGTLSNGSDGVAVTSTNGGQNAFHYGFNGTTWDRLRVDGSKNLNVNLQTAIPAGANIIGSVSQNGSWSVTANAGTNLNTSALALESGGNLATVAASMIAQEATTSGVKGQEAFGCVTTAKPTYTNLKSDCISLDVNGLQRMSLADTPSNTNNLNVNLAASAATVTITGTNLSTNLAQVNGVTTLTGAGTVGTGSARVAVGQDATTIAGSAPGTAGSASANVLTVQGIASMTPIFTQGAAASGATVTGNPVLDGRRAQNAEPTPVTNGQVIAAAADLTGKTIVMPYANKENFVSGCGTSTGTSGVSVIAAQGAGIKIYITSISAANTGAATSLLTIQNDPAGTPTTLWTTVNPAGGGSNFTFPTPLVATANKAVGFTAASANVTQYVCVAGYTGT